MRKRSFVITGPFFKWRVYLHANGTWYADGRSNTEYKIGRHSLAVGKDDDVNGRVIELDRKVAMDMGLINEPEPALPKAALALADGVRLYLERASLPRVTGGTRPKTQARYKAVLEKFQEFALDRKVRSWAQVSNDVLGDYVRHLQEKQYQARTLVLELTTIKQAFKYLIQEGYLKTEHVLTHRVRKIHNVNRQAFSENQVREMVLTCREDTTLGWLHDVVLFLAWTGCRIGEAAGLTWDYVDLTKDVVTFLNDPDSDPGTGSTTKNSRTRRVPIGAELRQVLVQRRKMAGIRARYVFHGPLNGRLKPDLVLRVLRRDVFPVVQERLEKKEFFDDARKLTSCCVHSLRHYFCSMCFSRGVPEAKIRDWMGHGSSVMFDHYRSEWSGDQAAAAFKQLPPLGGISAGEVPTPKKEEA